MEKKYTKLKEFKKYFYRQRKINIILFISMIIASSLGVIIPYFYSKRIIGITNVDHIAVIKFTIIIIIAILFHHLFWFLWGKLGSIITNRISKDIRKDIIKTVMDTKFSILKEESTGYYLERINNDTDEVSSFFVDFMGTMVDVFTNFCFFILIFIFNYICGLIFLAGTIVLYIFDSIRIKKEIIFTRQLRLLEEKFMSKNNENYRGIKDIKGLGIKENILLRTESVSIEISKLKTKKETTYAFWSRIKTFSQYLLEGILIVFSIVYLIPRGQLSVVMIFMILEYSGFMYELVDFISNIKERLNKGELSANRILEMFDNDKLEKFKESNKSIIKKDITIKKLSYSYDDNKGYKVLDNINLKIKENSATVFIGNSGSGKTTLFNLLSRILECDSNKIYIGDIDINLIDEKEFRNNVSIVNQSVFLLNDTVLENIKIVNPNSTIEEVYDACKKANIYDEITSFKKGFNTIISENGNNLSGGQQQRIGIARAILKDTPIILFDEPTSALDKKNQELFLDTINELKKYKTILVIAHKLNDYSMFNDVYEVKNGKITNIKKITIT